MTEDRGLDARILATATRRGRRLMTISELFEVGANYKTIEYRINEKGWARIHPTVIDLGAGPLTRLDRVHAAVLAGAVGATGFSAIWLNDLGDFSPATIEVAVRRGKNPKIEGATVHRHGHDVPVRRVQGIPCVCIEQAILDVSARLPATVLHRVFTRAWRKRLTTPKRMLRYIEQHAARGFAGSAKLRKVVVLYDTASRPPGDDYEADLFFLLLPALRKARIERPVLQYNLKIFDGRAEAVIDLAWPERRKALEVMGLDSHGDYEAQDYDYERAAAIRSLKWDLREVAPKAIRERPEQTVRRIIEWLRQPAPPL